MHRYLVAALAAACLVALTAAPAHAFTFGVGDRADGDVAASHALGARVYRVVIDPAIPLEAYAERIWRHRQAGQEPQLVIGGTGTMNHGSSRGVVRAAVAAALRWPSAYSIGVINEPNESGMSVCEYDRTWLAAYRSLRVLGVRRIPFGEWSPDHTLDWHRAALDPHRCPNTAPRIARVVRDVAWHGYWEAITYGPALSRATVAAGAQRPRLLVTEAGSLVRFRSENATRMQADLEGMRYWRRALARAQSHRFPFTELVAWDITSPPAHSAWDSSLLEPTGRPRPAYGIIRSTVHSGKGH